MEENVIINKLRVLINHLPFMKSEHQNFTIGKANLMLDEYFAENGKFLKTNISDWLPPNNTVEDRQAKTCFNCYYYGKDQLCGECEDGSQFAPAT